ncbi:signal peptidase I [Leptospira wolffii]|uniref:Signal peptidase I n=1 Tax=Leptospira wolffii TaxID=409998 RepID=A0A2M9Z9Y7_9LEPT|nr:DUF5684 domain-containing protein [Leptospira wolffii]PJZ65194.1 signal peptidase I [Leptospira wolffii]
MEETSGSGIGSLIGIIIYLGFIAASIVAGWKIFVKAGKPGWASIIPIYNIIVALEIVGRPIWWVLFFFIPCTLPFFAIILAIDFAKSYGKQAIFAILFFVLGIGGFILAFSDAKYVGPAAKSA